MNAGTSPIPKLTLTEHMFRVLHEKLLQRWKARKCPTSSDLSDVAAAVYDMINEVLTEPPGVEPSRSPRVVDPSIVPPTTRTFNFTVEVCHDDAELIQIICQATAAYPKANHAAVARWFLHACESPATPASR